MSADKDDELMVTEELAVSDGGAARFAAVEVKSGEEKYNVVWEQASRLMRFDEGENRWKERGQGTAKVLQHKDKAGQYMFVFRREGIGKLAAQHFLVKGMTVKVHPQSEKAVLWSTMKDYTDDEVGYPEKFVLRLTTPELAKQAVKEMTRAIDASST